MEKFDFVIMIDKRRSFTFHNGGMTINTLGKGGAVEDKFKLNAYETKMLCMEMQKLQVFIDSMSDKKMEE